MGKPDKIARSDAASNVAGGQPATGTGVALSWTPGALDRSLPPYLALLQALEADIREGVLSPGVQLPPHRALASHLGLSLSTVTKAYREAGVRGVVVGRIGQGTFVAASGTLPSLHRPDTFVNFSVNLSPTLDQRDILRSTFAELSRGSSLDGLFASDAHQGLAEHRAELANWVATPTFQPSAQHVFATNGAQHGLALAMGMLCRQGDVILVEELTYVGFKALASLHGYRLEPVAMDEEGLLPEALDARLRESGARLVYAMPTLHSPTARTMTAARRRAIADVIARHGVLLIEDDVYRFLLDPGLEPIAGLIPDRTIYLASFSKIFELGFRAGVMVVPPSLLDRAQLAMRASAWSATPLLFEVALRLIRSGAMKPLILDLQAESRRRVAVFQKIFPGQPLPHDGALSGYHVWLELSGGWTPEDLYFAARSQGVLITPPGSASATGGPEHGVRLCLGAARSSDFEHGLLTLRGLIARPVNRFSVA